MCKNKLWNKKRNVRIGEIMIKIAVDAMGGDFAPEQMVKGVNLAIKKNKDILTFLFLFHNLFLHILVILYIDHH